MRLLTATFKFVTASALVASAGISYGFSSTGAHIGTTLRPGFVMRDGVLGENVNLSILGAIYPPQGGIVYQTSVVVNNTNNRYVSWGLEALIDTDSNVLTIEIDATGLDGVSKFSTTRTFSNPSQGDGTGIPVESNDQVSIPFDANVTVTIRQIVRPDKDLVNGVHCSLPANWTVPICEQNEVRWEVAFFGQGYLFASQCEPDAETGACM